MATVDPSIALGVKPLQLDNPMNAMAMYSQIQGAQQANQLNRLKMEEYERARAEEEGVRNALARGDINLSTPEGRAGLLKYGKTGLEYGKALTEQQKAATERQAAEVKLIDDKLKQSRNFLEGVQTPDQYLAWHEANHRDPVLGPMLASRGITAEQSRARILSELAKPGGLQNLINESKLGVEKFAERNTMTAAEKANLGVAQGHLTLAQQNAAKPVWNEAGQGWVTPPTAKNPQGGFTPVPEVQATKDQRSAVKALTSAGYNPVTGEDTISKLINKSTSGGLQTLSSAAIAHIFGTSTEGRKAIAALEGTANQIATDIAGGKLGAGVSNTDREFIVSALGDVANPMKPAGDRLAGWEAAKTRMMRTGMIPTPVGAGGAPAAAVPPTPKGVDNSIWNAMTPEERALWK